MHKACLSVALVLAFAAAALAGGGPQNTLVLVNSRSTNSMEVGTTYARLRGLHERQLLRLTNVTTQNMILEVYSNYVARDVFAYLDAQGLASQITHVVIGPDLPYRVVFTNGDPLELNSSLPSCLYYGYYASTSAILAGCLLEAAASNAYFAAGRAFAREDTPGGRYLIAGQLYGWHGDEVRRLVERGRAADGTAPTGVIALAKTADTARSVRWPLYEEALFRAALQGTAQMWIQPETNVVQGVTNLLGYQTGIQVVINVVNNIFTPGAWGDHLTSYGGYLIDAPGNQMSILQWIRAGAAGSYGTIIEPCAYTEKFPDPRLFAWYERGFSLGESLYMSVQFPYQGLFVGDPLCQPFAIPSTVTATPAAPGPASGIATVLVTAASARTNLPVSRIDLYVDDLWHATLTNTGPRAGNRFALSVNAQTATYTAVEGDTLFTAAAGLAAAANSQLTGVTATVEGDSIMVTLTNFGVSGATSSCAAFAAIGTTDVLQAQAWAVTPQFVDPPLPAREFLALGGTADAGDTVRCIVTLTNGTRVTNTLVAAATESALSVMGRLQNTLNTNAALVGTNGAVARYLENFGTYVRLSLEARRPGPEGERLQVEFDVTAVPPPATGFSGTSWDFSDQFNDNESVLRPRALVRLAEGFTNLAASCVLDTTALADGPHLLRAVAQDGTAVRVQGHALLPLTVDNHALACSLTRPQDGQYFLRGGSVTTEVAVSGGTATQVVLFVEGKRAYADATAPYVFVWNTTIAGIGPVSVQAQAEAAGGVAALSERIEVVLYTDADGDGLSDQWEYTALGSATNFAGGDDPDGDTVPNTEEFLLDTNPSNTSARLGITAMDADPMGLVFTLSTARAYRVEVQDGQLDATPWTGVTNLHRGAGAGTVWRDAPTNAPAATNILRHYRLRAILP